MQEALDPQLASSEQPGRDAAISFVGGRPIVTPSQDGRGVDYDATLKDLLAVLTKTGDERRDHRGLHGAAGEADHRGS